jgi:hypothetical protein
VDTLPIVSPILDSNWYSTFFVRGKYSAPYSLSGFGVVLEEEVKLGKKKLKQIKRITGWIISRSPE